MNAHHAAPDSQLALHIKISLEQVRDHIVSIWIDSDTHALWSKFQKLINRQSGIFDKLFQETELDLSVHGNGKWKMVFSIWMPQTQMASALTNNNIPDSLKLLGRFAPRNSRKSSHSYTVTK